MQANGLFGQNPRSSYYDKDADSHYVDEPIDASIKWQKTGSTKAGHYNHNDGDSNRDVCLNGEYTGYEDDDSSGRLQQTFTVESGWASPRRCRRGLKIAQTPVDYQQMVMYTHRIQVLLNLLNLQTAENNNYQYRNLFIPMQGRLTYADCISRR